MQSTERNNRYVKPRLFCEARTSIVQHNGNRQCWLSTRQQNHYNSWVSRCHN